MKLSILVLFGAFLVLQSTGAAPSITVPERLSS